jgi:hypothetical protein
MASERDEFQIEGLTADDANEAVIALPAEVPLILIQQAFDLLVSAYGCQSLEKVHPGSRLPDKIGEHLTAGATVKFSDGRGFRLYFFAWDHEAGTKRSSWPPAVQGGGWVIVSAGRANDLDGTDFATTMRDMAARLQGFVSFGLRRSRKAGGDVASGWDAPKGDCVLEGVDIAKHRLLRTIGFDSAPVVERILRSEEARILIAQTLDQEPRPASPSGLGPRT